MVTRKQAGVCSLETPSPGARSAPAWPCPPRPSLAFPSVVAGPPCPRGADCRREKRHPRQCLGPAFFHIPPSHRPQALPGTCECVSRPRCGPQPRFYLLLMGVGWGGLPLVPWVRNPPGLHFSLVPGWPQEPSAGGSCWAGPLEFGREGDPSWGPWGAGVGGEERLGWTPARHQGCRAAAGPGVATAWRPSSLSACPSFKHKLRRHGPDAPPAPRLWLPGETFNFVLVNK